MEGQHNAGHGSGEAFARSSNLPAPYRSPWHNLGDDLQAIAADLRLRLQGLWRRNREGRLWRPAWWPAHLAPLFWLLTLVLALLLLLTPWLVANPGAKGGSQRTTAAIPARSAQNDVLESASAPAAPAQATAPQPPLDAEASRMTSEPAEVPTEAAAAPAAVEPSAAAPAATTSAAGTAGMTATPVAAGPPADPVQLWLQSAPAAALLAGARAEPAAGTLVLLLKPAFSALAADQGQQRAEVWQLQARELGFDHLELRDGTGALLARDALVGSGMIVLPAPPAP